MAGWEISSTLRNLKFMRRAVTGEQKKEDEEVLSNRVFGFSPAISKKCVAIMEGDPHPGAVKGRMSFQSFNPFVDKLAEELKTCSKDLGASTPNRNIQDDSSRNAEGNLNEDSDVSDSKYNHKRKQPVMEIKETQYPNKSPKNVHDKKKARASSSKTLNSKNKKKNEKTSWSVLIPPKKSRKKLGSPSSAEILSNPCDMHYAV